jgi:imidazolonepropionase-like amidohydrolase
MRLHGELSLLAESGLTPLEALRAATVDAAQVLGADQLGVIAAGQAADPAVRALRAEITVRSVT